MTSTDVVLALRLAVTGTALATTFAAHRSLFRGAATDEQRIVARRVGGVLAAIALAATAASHLRVLDDIVARVFPIGLLLGLGLAISSLPSPKLREAFDRLRDDDVRLLVATRAAFGSMLLGFGALGVLPESFALSAGPGDILAACAALAAPSSLDRSGSRLVRGVVHGVGLVDMTMVLGQIVLVVRPWALGHPGLVTTMTLPWLAVPLMVAIDLHGLRKVFVRAPQISSEPDSDGSQSARRVRGALS